MDLWNSDLALFVIQYLAVKEAGSLAATSKRYYYLVHQYRRLRGPELVAAASSSGDGPELSDEKVIEKALLQIQSPPNLVLAFSTPLSSVETIIHRYVPKDTVVLAAVADFVQTNINGLLDYSSGSSLMMASLPNNTSIKPFYANDEESQQSFFNELEQENQNDWKVFFVYVARYDQMDADTFVHNLQARYPNSTIIGGINSDAYVSFPTASPVTREEIAAMRVKELKTKLERLGNSEPIRGMSKPELVDLVYQHMQERGQLQLAGRQGGIFGVALGGDGVPVRSVVSRGVRSTSTGQVNQPSTSMFIHEVRMNVASNHCIIRLIRDEETGKIGPPSQFIAGRPNFIGVKLPGRDGFELFDAHPISLGIESFILDVDASDKQHFQNAPIDFFNLDSEACKVDMENAMSSLKQETAGEQLLGAVMVSCAGRGPWRGGLMVDEMADATYFANAFPDVPCLGFYAGGEIGPKALGGRTSGSVFQKGKASLQGFTAVFCVFVVPVFDLRGAQTQLDDSQTNVEAYFAEEQQRLSAK